jgi:hypothetical protein
MIILRAVTGYRLYRSAGPDQARQSGARDPASCRSWTLTATVAQDGRRWAITVRGLCDEGYNDPAATVRR